MKWHRVLQGEARKGVRKEKDNMRGKRGSAKMGGAKKIGVVKKKKK